MQEETSTPIMVKNKLPRALTSYDVLKSIALILMIIDHLGVYFFMDDEIFRIIGRLSAPIWLFLIGYARSTEITPKIWVCAIVVAIAYIVAGMHMLPLNILFVIILMRHIRDNLAYRCFYSKETLRGMFLLLFFSIFFVEPVLEYGAVGMMFMLYGYMVRNPEIVQKNIDKKYLQYFVIASFGAYILFQLGGMEMLSYPLLIVMTGVFTLQGYLLSKFKPAIYENAGKYLTRPIVAIMQFFGRRSLEIYAAHILLFIGLSIYFYPAEYNPLSWDFLPRMVVELLAMNGISL